jgi:hypothetical protein
MVLSILYFIEICNTSLRLPTVLFPFLLYKLGQNKKKVFPSAN